MPVHFYLQKVTPESIVIITLSLLHVLSWPLFVFCVFPTSILAASVSTLVVNSPYYFKAAQPCSHCLSAMFSKLMYSTKYRRSLLGLASLASSIGSPPLPAFQIHSYRVHSRHGFPVHKISNMSSSKSRSGPSDFSVFCIARLSVSISQALM